MKKILTFFSKNIVSNWNRLAFIDVTLEFLKVLHVFVLMVARLASVSQFYLNSVASLVAPAFQRVQICLVKSQYPALVLIELTTLDLKIQNGKVFNVNHILNVNFLPFHTELHSSHFTWKVHDFSSLVCFGCVWTLSFKQTTLQFAVQTVNEH